MDYKALSAEMPECAIQRTKGEETRKGFNTTGFGYQYVVNRLNDVCGIDGWTLAWEILKEIEGIYATSKKPYFEVIVAVSIGIGEAGAAVTRQKRHVGSHTASNYGDALKGAITGGVKKCGALFGVGKQAFEGSLDDDASIPEEHGERQRAPNSTKSAPSGTASEKQLKKLYAMSRSDGMDIDMVKGYLISIKFIERDEKGKPHWDALSKKDVSDIFDKWDAFKAAFWKWEGNQIADENQDEGDELPE